MVLTGLDLFTGQKSRKFKGANAGLVVHPASVDRNCIHAVERLRKNENVRIRRLFGPQHGIFGETQDNMIEWEGFKDPGTGIDVVSLYGKNRAPLPEWLEDLDVVIIDLQDVGTRCYTFIWTMTLVMEACVETGTEVVILDRPNPVGGDRVEGPMLKKGFESFVGRYPVPVRHGMTMGELALLFNGEYGVGNKPEVIRMQGWKRGMHFEDTGLPWVPPSPNIPTPETTLLYVGFHLLEGTNISEARGTTRPFHMCGTPFINPWELREELDKEHLQGVFFRPLYFEPTFQKYAGQRCGGVEVRVKNKASFEPVLTCAAVIKTIRNMSREFQWRLSPYEYEYEKFPIDILSGSDKFRKDIEDLRELEQMVLTWEKDLSGFREIRQKYLLYE